VTAPAPNHHVPEALLVAHAAGVAAEAVSLFVAAHTSLCPSCAARVATEEARAAAHLADTAPVAPSPGLRARVLAGLEAPPPPERRPDPLLPAPLLRYLPADPPWRRVVPGLELVELPLALAGQPAVLTRLAPGARVPRHDHAGLELQLVLSGGYLADEGRFARGDAHCADPAVTHGFRIDPDAPCVTLLVRSERIRPRGLGGALFAWLTGA
jgi:putative transcriptional regulator